MKLPNLAYAVVAEAKLSGYLLSSKHRDGRHKAAFFESFGFNSHDWQELRTALLRHAEQWDVVRTEPSPFGTGLIVEGPMSTPDGRAPAIRAVWFIDTGEDVPRFVTAYPLKGESHDQGA